MTRAVTNPSSSSSSSFNDVAVITRIQRGGGFDSSLSSSSSSSSTSPLPKIDGTTTTTTTTAASSDTKNNDAMNPINTTTAGVVDVGNKPMVSESSTLSTSLYSSAVAPTRQLEPEKPNSPVASSLSLSVADTTVDYDNNNNNNRNNNKYEPPTVLLSERQNNVLATIIDTLLPSIPIGSSNNNNSTTIIDISSSERTVWEYSLVSDPIYRNYVVDTIANKIPSYQRVLFQTLLSVLGTRIGTVAIFQKPYVRTSFDQLSQKERITLFQQLESSHYQYQRQIFQGLKRLIGSIATTYYYHRQVPPNTITSSNDDDDDNNISFTSQYYNPFWDAIGYIPGPELYNQTLSSIQAKAATNKKKGSKNNNHDNSKTQDDDGNEVLFNKAIISLDNHVTTSSNITTTIEQEQQPSTLREQYEYDFIIVGSGPGGCVATYVLGTKLKNVSILLLERGSYIPRNDRTNLELDGFDTMYQQHGLLGTNDGNNILILAGQTLGGGSTINWSCCLPLPDYVRAEWNILLDPTKITGPDQTFVPFNDDEYTIAVQTIVSKISVKRTPGISSSEKQPKEPATYHNPTNQILIDGCNKLGWQVAETGQNLQRPDDTTAGYICFGDKYDNKNDGIKSFILPLLEQIHNNDSHSNQHHPKKKGTKSNDKNSNDEKSTSKLHIVPNCKVHRIITTPTSRSSIDYDLHHTSTSKLVTPLPRATGVECTIEGNNSGQPIQFKARRGVILAAGALQTPCILQRSKFTNKHIGKHLRLHPVVGAFGFTKLRSPPPPSGLSVSSSSTASVTDTASTTPDKVVNNGIVMEEDTIASFEKENSTQNEGPNADNISGQEGRRINCFLGAPMTTVCDEFQMGISKDGYGYRIECPSCHPGLTMAINSWKSPIHFKQNLLRYGYAVPFLILQRDSDYDGGGSVRCNSKGEILVDYKISTKDKLHLQQGLQNALRILAQDPSIVEISTPHINDPGFFPDRRISVNNDNERNRLEEYINKIPSIGLNPFETIFASAHQMGTCRMSATPGTGVVDCITGETWECSNLYIMDTSIFPTASGANPMITVLTLSYILSSRLALLTKYQQSVHRREANNLLTPLSTSESSLESIVGMSLSEYTKAQLVHRQRLNLRSQGYPLFAQNNIRVAIEITKLAVVVAILFGPLLWLLLKLFQQFLLQ